MISNREDSSAVCIGGKINRYKRVKSLPPLLKVWKTFTHFVTCVQFQNGALPKLLTAQTTASTQKSVAADVGTIGEAIYWFSSQWHKSGGCQERGDQRISIGLSSVDKWGLFATGDYWSFRWEGRKSCAVSNAKICSIGAKSPKAEHSLFA